MHLEQVDSTNTYAKDLDEYPAEGITVVWADRQSAGRGQRGNTFFSKVLGGIWASFVIPLPDITQHFSYNRALSLAIAESVESVAGTDLCKIKWPNDIYLNDRKLCGILLEGIRREGFQMIAGFGINVTFGMETFPAELHHIATSIFVETGKKISCETLLYEIAQRFTNTISIDYSKPRISQERMHERYLRRLYKPGSSVRIGNLVGVFEGVDSEGHCLLNCEGTIRQVSSGPMIYL